jgi:hypothetical protein
VTDQAQTQPNAAQTLARRTVCIQVALSRPGNSRKLASGTVESDADPAMISATKKLVESEALSHIARLDAEIGQWMRAMSLSPLLKGGVYLVATTTVMIIEERLDAFRTEREQLIAAFADEYPACIESARAKLGSLFNQKDYLTADEARQKFGFDLIYLSFDTPEALRDVRATLFERERKRFEAKWATAAEEATLMLRQQMLELVDHMVDRMSPDADGKAKIFKGSLVTNMAEFLETLPFRNVLDDRQLDQLCARAKTLLAGVDVKALRKDDNLRANLATDFAAIKQQLDALVATRPTRIIQQEQQQETAEAADAA